MKIIIKNILIKINYFIGLVKYYYNLFFIIYIIILTNFLKLSLY